MSESTLPERAVWLLDVDGVLNGFGRCGWHSAPRTRTLHVAEIATGFPIRWAPQLMEAIRRLHEAGRVEIRWATTWVDYPDDLAALARMLDLPEFPHAYVRKPWQIHPEAKYDAARDVVASGRALIWTDDDAIPSEGDPRRDVFSRVDALLIAPDRRRGLRPEHLEQIEAWISGVAS